MPWQIYISKFIYDYSESLIIKKVPFEIFSSSEHFSQSLNLSFKNFSPDKKWLKLNAEKERIQTYESWSASFTTLSLYVFLYYTVFFKPGYVNLQSFPKMP